MGLGPGEVPDKFRTNAWHSCHVWGVASPLVECSRNFTFMFGCVWHSRLSWGVTPPLAVSGVPSRTSGFLVFWGSTLGFWILGFLGVDPGFLVFRGSILGFWVSGVRHLGFWGSTPGFLGFRGSILGCWVSGFAGFDLRVSGFLGLHFLWNL